MGSPSLLQTLSIAVICILVLGTVVTEGIMDFGGSSTLQQKLQSACQSETARNETPFICYLMQTASDSDQPAIDKRQDPTAFSSVEKLRRTLLRQLFRQFCNTGLNCKTNDAATAPSSSSPDVARLAQYLASAGINPSQYLSHHAAGSRQ